MNRSGGIHPIDNVPASRSELKYMISEEAAERVRCAATLLMDVDRHTVARGGTYPVHTIYLDSPDFAIYRKSVNKEADRFKLRMRFYDDELDSPVFLEVKGAASGLTLKKRFPADREAASALFRGDWNGCAEMAANGDGEFWDAVRRFGARPAVHIGYEREAFVGRDDTSTRLTMDRQIRFEPSPRNLSTVMRKPIPIWSGKVILEIKFAERMPEYLNEMIRWLGLETTKASKYVQSVASKIEKEQSGSGASRRWSGWSEADLFPEESARVAERSSRSLSPGAQAFRVARLDLATTGRQS